LLKDSYTSSIRLHTDIVPSHELHGLIHK